MAVMLSCFEQRNKFLKAPLPGQVSRHNPAQHIDQSASERTEYDRAGNFNAIVEPTLGLSSFCGTTRFGSAKVLTAFKSVPVIVSNAVTLVGVKSCQVISKSCAFSKSRFSTNMVAVFFSGSRVATMSR